MEKGQGKRMDTLQTDKVFTRKEYIERKAAIAETRKPRLTDAELRRRLANIPAADVVPVVRGHWIQRKENDGVLIIPFVSCSLCHYAWDFETPFCPNCGARMDGDGDV